MWLQQYPMIENRTGPQTIEFLTKRVVALGAVQVGQFLVDCETYMSVPQLVLCLQSLTDSKLSSKFHVRAPVVVPASTRLLAQMAVAWPFKDAFRFLMLLFNICNFY
ncbi:Mediator of RNA polymerase II transcription subunit 20 [Cyphomyrmex costatus]|uniref:Mediator of RNA polymerase II transcription subunit 20 n=1 Tax=Cyphomyrmex costatus TaxID=456900 RepID=A0A151IMP7_9HYME|nr:Mediator of RNA polymerase II transcription subunit 20 [Cyphomyrmex costatus]